MSDLKVHLEHRQGWGMANDSVCRVVRPTCVEDIQAAYSLAREKGWTVAFWGNGRSYGDAALNESNLLLDFRSMRKVLHFDPETSVLTAEPGITLVELEHYALAKGFWPPVVSGTMHTTLGGCVAANVHGKNNWKYGPWGDHVLSFTLVTPDGEVREVSRDSEPDLFRHAIGGFGLLGAFVQITIRMKRVYSGRLWVAPYAADDLGEMFRLFRQFNEQDYDYVVGWIDAFPGGEALGRGQIHAARYAEQGEDPEGAQMMLPEDQELPDRFFGVIPKGWLWFFARPFAFRLGMRLINLGRFWWMKLLHTDGQRHLESHARFNHLLDFVPNWKWFYKPGGLIQYQLFLRKENAEAVARQAFQLCQEMGLESWLVVMKRHRADEFPLSHAVDGYSFAMDFPVTERNRGELYRMAKTLDRIVVKAGGRFYFAKDSVVSAEAWRASLGDEVLGRFFALKRRFDEGLLIQGNLWRRVMAPLYGEVPLIEQETPDFSESASVLPATEPVEETESAEAEGPDA